MISLKTPTAIFLFLLLHAPLSSRAALWPVFLPPDKDFLLKQGLIDVASCPLGEGKILNGVVINISQFRCKTFCPDSWVWVVESDEKCRELARGFEFQGYDIQYNRDEEGTVNYSDVTAFFGTDSGKVAFRFTSAADEHWYCFERNAASHAITCGNDI